jgi:hypothetical protein
MNAQLLDVQRIWDQAPHNAMTDLIRYKNRWFCVFREGMDHISTDGSIRVIVSDDGITWTSASRLSLPGADLRDPKVTITPSGTLMLNAVAALDPPTPYRHQSLVWFSENGIDWSAKTEIGDPNFWIWRVTWKNASAYGIGYSTVQPPRLRLYAGQDGVNYSILADNMVADGCPNEATIVFPKDNTAVCLLRRETETATALLGISHPGYSNWEWKDLGVRIGGPNLLILPDKRIVAAFRRDIKKPRTSLNWLDTNSGVLTEFLSLPSGGDTSYPGLYWHEDLLWVSYYSSHEERTSIYLAKIKFENQFDSPPRGDCTLSAATK